MSAERAGWLCELVLSVHDLRRRTEVRERETIGGVSGRNMHRGTDRGQRHPRKQGTAALAS